MKYKKEEAFLEARNLPLTFEQEREGVIVNILLSKLLFDYHEFMCSPYSGDPVLTITVPFPELTPIDQLSDGHAKVLNNMLEVNYSKNVTKMVKEVLLHDRNMINPTSAFRAFNFLKKKGYKI